MLSMKPSLLIATSLFLVYAALTRADATASAAASTGLTDKDREALTETADALYDLANAGWGTEHKYIDASAI
jgi:hypothetical protein